MIDGGQRRKAHIRTRVNSTVLQRRLERLAADLQLQLPEHAIDAQTACDACHSRPAGHGHFGLYCEPCSELPYGQAAAL